MALPDNLEIRESGEEGERKERLEDREWKMEDRELETRLGWEGATGVTTAKGLAVDSPRIKPVSVEGGWSLGKEMSGRKTAVSLSSA